MIASWLGALALGLGSPRARQQILAQKPGESPRWLLAPLLAADDRLFPLRQEVLACMVRHTESTHSLLAGLRLT